LWVGMGWVRVVGVGGSENWIWDWGLFYAICLVER
jgi:hypothetical protein